MKINEILTGKNLPNWDVIEKISEFQALKETPQSSIWHKEGNCFVHTKLVTEHIVKLLSDSVPFRNGKTESAFSKYTIDSVALVVAALCHDLGKATTTKMDEKTGEWKTESHGLAGERITRRLFFDEPDILLRERICWLVRQHMALHHIFNDLGKVYKKLYRLYFDRGNLLELCYLNYADSMGSINEESANGDGKIVNRIVRLLEIVSAYPITHEDAIRQYYGLKPDNNSLQGPKIHVMVGIAGSGKSTYAKENYPDVPIVSRDDIRVELGYVKEGEKAKLEKSQEQKVTNVFYNKCNSLLKNGSDIVIDNLNLSKKYRDEYHKRFVQFNPFYEYVYVEAPTIEDNVKRRKGQIMESEIYRMLNTMDFPEPHEYNKLQIVKQKQP